MGQSVFDSNPLLLAADEHNLAASKTSSIQGVSDWITKGVPGAITAGLVGIANTPIDLYNIFASEDAQRFQTEDWISNAFGKDMTDYYKQHQSGIELGGFLLSSIPAGLAGIKALRAIQAGRTSLGASFNFFRAKQEQILGNTLKAIEDNSKSVYGILNREKFKAAAFGAGDTVLQTLAADTMVLAAYHANPIFENMDFVDYMKNSLLWGSAFGAAGGLVKYAKFTGQVNRKLIEVAQKDAPWTSIPVLENFANPGDAAATLLKWDSELSLPTSPKEERLFAEARQNVMTNVQQLLHNTTADVKAVQAGTATTDANLANGFMDLITRSLKSGPSTEVQRAQNLAHISDVLVRLKTTSRITEDSQRQWTRQYINPQELLGFGKKAPPGPINPDHVFEVSDLNGFKIGYQELAGTAKTPSQYPHQTAAFNDGVDLFFDRKMNPVFNRNSKNVRFVDQSTADLYINFDEGNLTSRAFPTVGDLTPANFKDTGHAIQVSAGGGSLLVSGRVFPNRFNTPQASWTKDSLTANARFVWADKVKLPDTFTVHEYDIPMLQRMQKELEIAGNSATKIDAVYQRFSLIDSTGKAVALEKNFGEFVLDKKRELANQLLATGKFSSTEVSRMVGSKQSWIDNAFTTDGHTVDPASYLRPSGARLTYDITGPQFEIGGHVARGFNDVLGRLQVLRTAEQLTADQFFGDAARFLPSWESTRGANIVGAGASFYAAASAEYTSTGSITEAIGRAVQQVFNKRATERIQTPLAAVSGAVLQNEKVAQELGFIQQYIRSTSSEFGYVPDPKRANTWTLSNIVEAEAKGSKRPIPNLPAGVRAHLRISPELHNFLKVHAEVTSRRNAELKTIASVKGIDFAYRENVLYFPPPNTARVDHVVFVRPKEGVFPGGTSTRAIMADNPSDLAALSARVDPEKFDIITKAQSRDYHRLKGDFDAQLSLNENLVDSSLQRSGALAPYFPNLNGKAMIEDLVSWHLAADRRLVRDMVELKYAPRIAELKALGEDYVNYATSKFKSAGPAAESAIDNPYNNYIKTMLNISRLSEYRGWSQFANTVDQYGSQAFQNIKRSLAEANSGNIPYAEVAATAKRMGFESPYKTAFEYIWANTRTPSRPVSDFVQKANGIVFHSVLGLDFWNSLINIISTPITGLSEIAAFKNQIENGALGHLTQIADPLNKGLHVPSNLRLLARAINNYFVDSWRNGGKLMKEYQDAGFVKNVANLANDMAEQLAVGGNETAKQLLEKTHAAIEIGTKITGNNFAEQFTRFISANIMDQMVTELKIPRKEAYSFIGTYVNRVQGNYLASQRPILFQGPVGQAIGLFQTYQFNLLQSLFRHVENGQTKALGILFGLQGSIYGLQGTPAFHAINQHLVGNAGGNPTHEDFYTGLQHLVGVEVGDWLMYGLASAVTGSALYTRGDLNPRQVTVVPTDISSVPAVAFASKFLGNLYETAKRIDAGGDTWKTILQGFEHNGINRPLTGLAQVLQGYSTTAQGNLITSGIELNTLADWGRLAGSRPLTEAVALDAYYRTAAYQAADKQKRDTLTAAMRTKFIRNEAPSTQDIQDFASEYVKIGGTLRGFNRSLAGVARTTNVGVVNRTFKNMNDPLIKNLYNLMGGQPLEDYVNSPEYQAATQDQGDQ